MNKIIIILVIVYSNLFASTRCGFGNHLHEGEQIERVTPPKIYTISI